MPMRPWDRRPANAALIYHLCAGNDISERRILSHYRTGFVIAIAFWYIWAIWEER